MPAKSSVLEGAARYGIFSRTLDVRGEFVLTAFTLKLDPDIGGLVDRHHLALHLGYFGSSLLVTTREKAGQW